MPDVLPIGKQNSEGFRSWTFRRAATAGAREFFVEKRKRKEEEVLGGGLEPPCLAAYAPQTYVSAISPPERVRRGNGKS
jgi:hypothetical protein